MQKVEMPPNPDLFGTLQHQLLVHYFMAAAVALFVYDVLIHLDVEIKYIWAALDPQKSPGTKKTSMMFNLLYLSQRYLPIFDQVIVLQYFLLGASSPRACRFSYSLSACLAVFGVLLSEGMLALRILAVWGRKTSIIVILVVIQLGCVVPGLFYFEKFVAAFQFAEPQIPGSVDDDITRSCFDVTKNKDMYVFWVILLIYDIVSLILIAIPGFRAYQSGGRSSSLVKVVFRDGVIYYALISMVSLVNVIVILNLPSDLTAVLSPFERVLHSVLASHAIIYIRQEAWKNSIHTSLDFTGGTMMRELNTINTEISFALGMSQSVDESENHREEGV